MSESFSVGEIAELVYAKYHDNPPGTECEIFAPLDTYLERNTGELVLAYGIVVEGRQYLARLDQLRKKRPPQDWVKLCNLTDLPCEVVCE